MYAIADDITGAAEIAGIGHRAGLRSFITLKELTPIAGADLVVADTDSRLLPEPEAVARIERAAARLREAARQPEAFIYKKTDSVLRGHPRREVEVLALALGRRRMLFVPCNPAAGRTIRDGAYRVGGVPIAETEFAHDPHHPARSSLVGELLGPGECALHITAAGAPLPAVGIIIGEAGNAEDVARWARCVDETTLPAGGGEFFAALLAARAMRASPIAPPPSVTTPVLVICGSMADAARSTIAAARSAGKAVLPMPDLTMPAPSAVDDWVERVCEALCTRGLAYVVGTTPVSTDSQIQERITAAFSRLGTVLHARGAFRHLVIEGGATAAAVLHALGVDHLEVTGEWAPGVVSLASGRFGVTMKPGSYPWPQQLCLEPAARRSGCRHS